VVGLGPGLGLELVLGYRGFPNVWGPQNFMTPALLSPCCLERRNSQS
jgi:hypothetical protein